MADSNVRILMVAFSTIEGLDIDKLVEAFRKGVDWIRVVDTCFLIKTVSDAQRWYGRLEPLLSDKHTMFICRVDLNDRQGFLPKGVWEWIDAETASALGIPTSFADLGKLPPKA